MSNVAAGRRLDVDHARPIKGKNYTEVTWKIRESSSLDDVLSVESF